MTASPKTRTAVLLDIDGTLVDSNYLHIEAWSHAFADMGLAADAWRVHRAIGMDSSMLLERVLGEQPDDVADEAKRLHARHYASLAPRIRRFPDVPEFVAELHRRGVGVVLATSAPEAELEILREVLDIGAQLETSGDDVETAKPAPDIVAVALDTAGVVAAHAVFVGDSVWDMTAAGKLGVTGIGLLTGGSTAADLREAGAVAVYDSVSDLLSAIDDGPIGALGRG